MDRYSNCRFFRSSILFMAGFLVCAFNSRASFGSTAGTLEINDFPIEMKYLEGIHANSINETLQVRIQAWAALKKQKAYFAQILPVEVLVTDSKMQQYALMSISRRVNPSYLGRIFAHNGNKLLHIQVAGQQLALYLVNYPAEDVRKLIDFMATDTAGASNSDLQSEKLREIASEVVYSTSAKAPSVASRESDYGYILSDSFKGCGAGAKDAYQAMFITPFTSAYSSLKSLRQNPSRWWTESVNQTSEIFMTISQFDEFAAQKWADFKTKSSGEKSQLYCSLFFGGVGGGAAAKVAQKAFPLPGSSVELTSARTSLPQTVVANASLKDAALVEALEQFTKRLSDPSRAGFQEALKQIKLLEKVEFSREYAVAQSSIALNNRMISLTEALKKVIYDTKLPEPLRTQAAEAYVHFGRLASNGWLEGYVGRAMTYELPRHYHNYHLPDSIRRVFHSASQEVSAARGAAPLKDFQPSEQLKRLDARKVDFLGRSRMELDAAQRRYVDLIDQSFPNETPNARAAIFSRLESGKGIEPALQNQLFKTATIRSRRDLEDLLVTAGFEEPAERLVGRNVFVHPQTGKEVVVIFGSSPRLRPREMSASEIESVRSSLLNSAEKRSIFQLLD